MADKVKGITVEIGGDTVGLQNALKDTNKEINSTQKELKEVEKLLKFDPTNTTLLAQKQQLLGNQIQITTQKLDALKQAKDKADKSGNIDKNSQEYRNLERQIVATEQSLNKLGEEAQSSGDKVKELGDKSEKSGDKLKVLGTVADGVVKGMEAIAAAGVEAGTAVVGMAVNSGKTADDLNALSSQTGISTENLQKFAYASDMIDVSMDTLTGSMSKLTKNMSNAKKGSGDAYDAFNQLGVAFTNADGSLRDNEDVFNDAIRALGQMQNETERDAMAMKLFGKSAQDPNPLIEGGIDDLEKYSKQAEELGLILSQDTLDGANAFNDQLDILKANATGAFQAIGSEIAADLLPELTELQEMSTEAMLALVQGYKEGGLDGLVDAMGQALTKLLATISAKLPALIKMGTNLLTSLLNGIKDNLPAITSMATDIVALLLEGILSMLPQILEMGIELISNLTTGIAQQLPELIPLAIQAILNLVTTLLDNIDQLIDAGIELIIGLADGLIEAIPILLEKVPVIIEKLLNALINNAPKLLEASLKLIVTLAEGIITNIPELLKAIPKIIVSLVNAFNNYMNKVKEIGTNLVKGIFEGIKNAKDWLWNKLKEWCNGIVDKIKDFFGIESPSKLFRDEVGKYMALGLGEGFVKTMPQVIDEMQKTLSNVTLAMADLTIGEIPEADNRVTQQNFYSTKNVVNTTEVVRQPSQVVLEIDKRVLGQVVVPAYNKEMNRIGVAMA